MSQPYLELLRMADEELALAVSGRWSELPEAIERRARQAAALPPTPPADAVALLRRLAVLQGQLEDLLAAAQAGADRELTLLARSREALRGYHPTAMVGGARINRAA